MRVNNRTQEFYSTVESMMSRRPFGESFRLMGHESSETQFYKIAKEIGQENAMALAKLQKLSELVKQNSLLDDKLPEITQLIQTTKMDISKMSSEVSAFQKAFKGKKIQYIFNKNSLEHANNVFTSLQTKIANTSNEFKEILELRTKIMREQKQRREQYGSSSLANPTSGGPTSVSSSANSSPLLFSSKIISKIATPLTRSHTASPAPPVQDPHFANKANAFTPPPIRSMSPSTSFSASPRGTMISPPPSSNPNRGLPPLSNANPTPPPPLSSSSTSSTSFLPVTAAVNSSASPYIPSSSFSSTAIPTSSSTPLQPPPQVSANAYLSTSATSTPPLANPLYQPASSNKQAPSSSSPYNTTSNNLLNPFPTTTTNRSSPSPYMYSNDRKPTQGIAISNSVNFGTEQRRTAASVASGSSRAHGSDESLVISVNSILEDDDMNNGKTKGVRGGTYAQQQQMYEAYPQEYLETRSSAIDSIESTIAELGQIYQNFTQILAGQRETVQRIDDNIADVEMNVTGAQTHLMKYYKSISSNRWLIIKILGVVLFFFFIFVVFMK